MIQFKNCKDPGYFFIVNADTISVNKKERKILSVLGGVPPYTWYVTGKKDREPFKLSKLVTNDVNDVVTITTTQYVEVGYSVEEITVTDSCNRHAYAWVRCCYESNCCNETIDYFFTCEDVLTEAMEIYTVTCKGGCPPFTWKVISGNEKFQYAITNARQNIAYAARDGYNRIEVPDTVFQVTDHCNSVAIANIRSPFPTYREVKILDIQPGHSVWAFQNAGEYDCKIYGGNTLYGLNKSGEDPYSFNPFLDPIGITPEWDGPGFHIYGDTSVIPPGISIPYPYHTYLKIIEDPPKDWRDCPFPIRPNESCTAIIEVGWNSYGTYWSDYVNEDDYADFEPYERKGYVMEFWARIGDPRFISFFSMNSYFGFAGYDSLNYGVERWLYDHLGNPYLNQVLLANILTFRIEKLGGELPSVHLNDQELTLIEDDGYGTRLPNPNDLWLFPISAVPKDETWVEYYRQAYIGTMFGLSSTNSSPLFIRKFIIYKGTIK